MIYVLQKVLGAGWLLAAVCLLAPILTWHELIQEDHHPLYYQTQLHTTLSRPIWSLGVSWVIFVCVAGNGGKYCKGLLQKIPFLVELGRKLITRNTATGCRNCIHVAFGQL
jgi:hypothetical protein